MSPTSPTPHQRRLFPRSVSKPSPWGASQSTLVGSMIRTILSVVHEQRNTRSRAHIHEFACISRGCVEESALLLQYGERHDISVPFSAPACCGNSRSLPSTLVRKFGDLFSSFAPVNCCHPDEYVAATLSALLRKYGRVFMATLLTHGESHHPVTPLA
jgi:hypothetical protein